MQRKRETNNHPTASLPERFPCVLLSLIVTIPELEMFNLSVFS